MKRIVLGFSGSVAAAAAIPWLRERHGAEVITLTLDVGQGEELAAIRERALALGAVRAHVIDAREEFVRDYMLPALQAGAIMEGYALVYPLLGKRLIELARMESAAAIAHTSRYNTLAAAVIRSAASVLAPAIEVIEPAEAWTLSAAEQVAFVRESGVHVPSPARPRVDASLWGRRLDTSDPVEVEDAFTLTRAADECPEYPAIVDLTFVRGVPVAANGIELSMSELLESLETIAGAHGVGRSTERTIAFERPAVCVLGIAHAELASRTLGVDLGATRAKLAQIYSDALLNGRWFSDMRGAIDALSCILQTRITGTVKVHLLKGRCLVIDCAPGGVETADTPKAVA